MNRILMYFHNLRFMSKLFLSYIIIGLLPLIVWGVFSYKQTNEFLISQAKDSFDNMFDKVCSEIEFRISRVEDNLQTITKNENIDEIIGEEYENNYKKYIDVKDRFDPIIATYQTLNPEIIGITFYTKGSIKNARQCFKDYESLPNHIKNLFLNSMDTIWMYEEGKLYVMEQIFNMKTLKQTGVILLEINQNKIFENTLPDKLENFSLKVTNSNKIILEVNKIGLDINDIENKNIYTLNKNLSSNNWNVQMTLNMKPILIQSRELLLNIVLTVFISFILMILIIMVFTKTMNKRISKLNIQLSRIVKSGFKIDISSHFNDEIGEITNNIGTVVKEIQVMINEVYESKLIQREAEIKALQSQINPHFLYNTLSMINWEAIKSGNANISKVVNALSAFYRATLNKGDNITTVENELNNTKAYLEIQLEIHRNSFDVEYDIDEKILSYNMPNIILQPIVENAIEHGIDLKKTGRGLINIKAYEQNKDIVFEIMDNGMGMSEEKVQEIMSKNKKNYGVKNVNDRLKLFFDESYGLRFETQTNMGAKVVILIPQYISL